MSAETHHYLSDEDVVYFIRVFTLLYADDTIVLAETAEQLQLALNAVYEYCQTWKLTVNIDKTKIVIFCKRKVTEFPAFLFGHRILENVDDYTYLGVIFNYNGSFDKAIAKQILQGKRAFYALLARVKKLRIPIDIALELFNQMVLPILLYGSEIWGFQNITQIEVLYRKFLKCLLHINSNTPNVMVYGETGTHPIEIHVVTRMITLKLIII